MILFYTNSAKHLADRIKACKGKFILTRFSDNEIYTRIKDDVKGKKVAVIAGFQPPADNLLELIFMLDALKRLKAKIILIITYFGYARQDRVKKGEALSAAVVSRLISSYKPEKVYVIDMHSERAKKFLKFKNIMPLGLFVPFFKGKKELVVVAPDQGSLERANGFSKMINAPIAFLEKKRLGKKVKIIGVKGSLKGRDAVIADDIIASGATIIEAAKILMKKGAKEVSVVATHGIFSNNAVKNLEKSGIKKIWVTDTILQQKRSKRIKVISAAGIIERLIKC